MGYDWERYGRRGLDLASTMTSLGFTVAKSGTKLGFSIARSVVSGSVGLTALAVDHAVFGGSPVASPVVEGAVSSALTFVEKITLAPIFLGEYVTAASFQAAQSSIDVLSVIFPGSSEASFSLASFITLVKREWNSPAFGTNSASKKHGITEVARALVAWILLQGVTQEWQEQRWLEYLREIPVEDTSSRPRLKRVTSRIRVTSDVIFPGNLGQLISADIGEAQTPSRNRHRSASLRKGRLSLSSALPSISSKEPQANISQKSTTEIKATLRRFSKMVLAGYGGASLLFFGVAPLSHLYSENVKTSVRGPATTAEKNAEEAQLESAVNASEAEASGNYIFPLSSADVDSLDYSWWDILLGKHDQEIFERSVHAGLERSEAEVHAKIRATAVIGVEHQMPRFWVLTDHVRRQVVLVLRGTMSLNELAVDLTCDPVEFQPAADLFREERDESVSLPGHYPPAATFRASQNKHQRPSSDGFSPRYQVHGGMLRMARAMGEIDKPVHLAVKDALMRNPLYELVMCGHSLGAGVASLLGLMWADPTTCRTVHSSGLPANCLVSVYCFGPPCLMDAALSRLSSKLIVSLVYSNDVVSRLSLGAVRDIRNAALSLCDANEEKDDAEGYTIVTKRTQQWKAGHGSEDDYNWFIAVRKTLEANMQMADLFPPGRVLWALRDGDFHPSHRLHKSSSPKDSEKLRLFEVLDVEKIFFQIVFSKNMLSAHLPHRYDRALHDLL